MQIGLLQAGHMVDDCRPEPGDYPVLYSKLLEPEGITVAPYPVVDGVFPDSVHDHPAWLVSGSKYGVYDDEPWIPRLAEFLREAHGAGVPLVGICFGHQMIAHSLGGHAEKAETGWIVGRQTYDWGGEPVLMNAWHQDQVTRLPEGATVIATGPACPIAAYTIENRVMAMQAHPEFEDDTVDILMDVNRGGTPDDIIETARATLGGPIDNASVAGRIAQFLKNAVSHELA